MAKDEEDEIVVPKKSTKSTKSTASSSSSGSARGGGPTPQMRRLMRITSGIGIALGGFVTIVAVMGVVGLVVDNIWARLVVGVIAVIGLPAFLADRMLKRSDSTLATKGGLGMVASIFAIVLLGIALMLISAEGMTKKLFEHEGNNYARAGSVGMARAAYFLAGDAPTFPFEKPAGAKPAGSGSASVSVPGAPSASPPR